MILVNEDTGVELDITDQIARLLEIGRMADFDTDENHDFIMGLGRRIVLATGPNVPAGVLSGLVGRMPLDYAAYVGDLWAEAAEFPNGRPPEPGFRFGFAGIGEAIGLARLFRRSAEKGAGP
ncbi:hypothetical protein JL100_026480 [Skermanella mucosa]|uniref:hypothetical protein n=1 Tax=Skermanella mucosa TaxID=1789672 RepID=UPI00192C9477|nr:hypothetical protein [Skermanella mucosa]UEM20584.1 hypothetical protein JL100_026480 [Skermanella mucosa]